MHKLLFSICVCVLYLLPCCPCFLNRPVSQIVNICRVHYKDADLFSMSLRALGNLSYCDENIRFLVESGGVECIVEGMKFHAAAKPVVQFALEVRVS